MEWQFESVAGPFEFTEGPVWTGDAVLFTDIPNDRIMRYDPQTGACDEYRSGTNAANGLALDGGDNLYACEGRGEGRRIARYNSDGSATSLAHQYEGKRLNSPNDLAIDARGRIWFTDPRYGNDRSDMELDHESVFRLDPETGELTRVTFDTTRPNGLLVAPDLKTLYVAESDPGDDAQRELRAYPIQEDGTLGACEVMHNFFPHRGIDGMTLDAEGNIVATAGWTQSGPGPMIYVFTPNGRVLETHPMPTNPTNCTFGDANLQALYVTTSNGHLYRAQTHRKGLG